MDGLARLAADETVDYSREYGDLGSAVTQAHFASQREADAVTTIAGVLTKAATDRWRQRQLEHVIERANAPVQDLVGGLETVTKAFALDNANAATLASSYYRTVMLGSRDQAAIAALRDWQEARAAEFDDRHRALDAYAAILAKIGAGHQALFDDRDRLHAEDTLRQIAGYARELEKARRALHDVRE
jgi:hypothetical protein